jgi:hypothetical protein
LAGLFAFRSRRLIMQVHQIQQIFVSESLWIRVGGVEGVSCRFLET